jgi:hypothetical protein
LSPPPLPDTDTHTLLFSVDVSLTGFPSGILIDLTPNVDLRPKHRMFAHVHVSVFCFCFAYDSEKDKTNFTISINYVG